MMKTFCGTDVLTRTCVSNVLKQMHEDFENGPVGGCQLS